MGKKLYQLNIAEVMSNLSLFTDYDIGGEGHGKKILSMKPFMKSPAISGAYLKILLNATKKKRRTSNMKTTGIIRRIDDLGRVVVPKVIRENLKIHEGDAFEIFTDNNGAVTFKPYYKSWEQCAIDFYDNHPHIFVRKNSPYIFYCCGNYTACFINSNYNGSSRYGVAKRYVKDSHDSRIGQVAAYARAIGQPINEMIGYKGK